MARRNALFVAVLSLALAGGYAYQLLPRRLEPVVPSFYGVVELSLPGVSAAELEKVLTVPVEDGLMSLPDVLDCSSETRDGLVLIAVECEGSAVRSGTAWASIEDQLAQQRAELADGFIGLSGPVLHRPSESMAAALVSVTGSADNTTGATLLEGAQRLADALSALPSVDHVELLGQPRDQIVLSYEDSQLSRASLTPVEFREYLRSQHITAPGAYLHGTGSILPVETLSRITSYEALKELPVRDPADGDPVNLSRLLDVSREPLRPAIDRVEAEGRPAIALTVYRRVNTPLESFAAEVRGALAGFQDDRAISSEVVVFQPAVVAEEVDRFGSNLAQGFVVILVLLILALGLRTGISVAVVLPLVVLTSFIVLYAGGFSLDIVTLSSFILVLGLLVDNHIVMAERVQRLKELGSEHGVALARAGRELFAPLLAAAATTALGFLPIVLTNDGIGDYVSGLFWVVLITLAVSLVFCFAVTPLLLSRKAPAHRGRSPRGEGLYKAILSRSFGLVVPLLLLVAACCWGGYALLTSANQVFFPASVRPLWMVEIELPHGSDVEATAAVASDLDKRLHEELGQDNTALEHWLTFLGRSAPPVQSSIPQRRFSPHYGQVLLRLDPHEDPSPLQSRLASWAESQGSDVQLRIRPVRLGAQLEWPIQIEVRGPDAEIAPVAQRVAEHLAEISCLNINTDWGEPVAKLKVVPDREALSDNDLTVADLTLGMHSVLHGLPLFEILENGQRTPVMLRAQASRDSPREALSDAYVYPAKGDPSLLYEVAELRETRASPVRVRRQGSPAVTVRAESADPEEALLQEGQIDFWLNDLRQQHPQLTIEVSGLSASSKIANRSLLEQIPWALLLVLLCLLAQSRSLIDTSLILLTIPLSFTGVAFGLYVTGQPFSFMTLVGMTALAGIVVNNAIVLLASIRQRLSEGGGYSQELLIDSAAHRLRPIMLTTLCAMASMAVLYISGGPMWQPLATAVISGLTFSTLLVLFVLPVMYGKALQLSGDIQHRGGHGSETPEATAVL
ncbi:MAG: multidrug efflux pump [Pseudohongiellaceae bacterium]|jgi:multidrug efflux pump